MSTKSIIESWYRRLEFPKAYDEEFYEALNTIEIPEDTTVDNYDRKGDDGKKNLLAYLYLCESMAQGAKQRGIPDEVITETLKDLVIWTENFTGVKGSLYLGELGWLKIHMTGTMFRLGRLQFRMAPAFRDIPEAGVKQGDNVMEIHIPRGEKMTAEECDRSFAWAKEFFPRYFPEYSFSCYTCWSWLLDDTLKEFLAEDSNILRFGARFTKVYKKEGYFFTDSVFGFGVGEEKVGEAVCRSSFAQKLKDAVLAKKPFYITLGFIPKELC